MKFYKFISETVLRLNAKQNLISLKNDEVIVFLT